MPWKNNCLSPADIGDAIGECPVNQNSWYYLTQNRPPPVASTVLTQQASPQRSPLDQISVWGLNFSLLGEDSRRKPHSQNSTHLP